MLHRSYTKKLLVLIRNGAIVLIGAVLVFYLLFRLELMFRIKRIEVSPEEVSRNMIGTVSLYRQSSILLNTDQVVKELSIKNPLLEHIVVTKKYPDTLIISAEERTLMYQLQLSQGVLLIDPQGIIIGKRSQASNFFPHIYYYQEIDSTRFSPGQLLPIREVAHAVMSIDRFRQLGILVERVDIQSIGVLVLRVGQFNVFFSTEKDIRQQLQDFEIVYQQFKLQGQGFSRLDFRFDKPVVEFK